jgi:two-component system sensor histidine kinase VicK
MIKMKGDNSHKFLQDGGEMGQSIRSFNWAASPLGPVESWPTSLKIILSTPFPMYIAWGKGYTQLYNDGYRPILG